MLLWSSVILALLLVLALAHFALRRQANAAIETAREKLLKEQPNVLVPAGHVPMMARAFACRAISGASRPPRAVILTQRAEMRFSPRGRWFPVTATQTISVARPGFLWLARARLAGLSVRVIDCLVGAEGWIDVRLFGSAPVARAKGADADKGELMRYLAELAWAPHAFLYNHDLSWSPLEDDWVEVSAPLGDGTATVSLCFDASGDLVEIAADDRPRQVGRKTVPTPWRGYFSDYRNVGGLRIPTRAKVSWMLEEGHFTYWRGEIIAIQLEY
jgi:hypothetical protein